MDPDFPPSAKKLLCDYILLLLLSRQSMVFRIEKRYRTDEYPGGSNENITKQIDYEGFVNPVPDFITYCRSVSFLSTYFLISTRLSLLDPIWMFSNVRFY